VAEKRSSISTGGHGVGWKKTPKAKLGSQSDNDTCGRSKVYWGSQKVLIFSDFVTFGDNLVFSLLRAIFVPLPSPNNINFIVMRVPRLLVVVSKIPSPVLFSNLKLFSAVYLHSWMLSLVEVSF
jgi:hypothetical protein